MKPSPVFDPDAWDRAHELHADHVRHQPPAVAPDTPRGRWADAKARHDAIDARIGPHRRGRRGKAAVYAEMRRLFDDNPGGFTAEQAAAYDRLEAEYHRL